ncbi:MULTISPECIES: formyltransferase family protein [Photobacterium]|uniref:phosphoribosylglycinamide formyltransferase 1 n=1 Tax=Photobacterium malacitanum TaxID=2204294 RepID=A0A1Y6MS99_9GAMM|nr:MULTISPECIES: formyltransferase family protein [Photobacterium]SMY38161.1 phosphoribosylglycinamide formyltransferase [Photobacterium malacitanum]
MKIVAFIGDQPNHWGLISKVSQIATISSVVTVSKKYNKKKSYSKFIQSICALPLSLAWRKMQRSFIITDEFKSRVLKVSTNDINSDEVLEFIVNESPDLVIVSGTNLLGAKLIKELSKTSKIMNLHTGISPYVKGGPNCTNWCLSNRNFHLIGNTVMWLDDGIDTGNLIVTEKCPLIGNESLSELHIKVMNHAHDIYSKVIKAYVNKQPLQNISQHEISSGHLYLTKDWNKKEVIKALYNYYFYFSNENINNNINDVLFVNTDNYKKK